jgi:hypothetical protein
MADTLTPTVIDISSHKTEEVDAQLRQALDEIARSIGRAAVNHLKEMYPAALDAVTKNAEVSLTNFIRNRINFEMRPVIDVAVNHWREAR